MNPLGLSVFFPHLCLNRGVVESHFNFVFTQHRRPPPGQVMPHSWNDGIKAGGLQRLERLTKKNCVADVGLEFFKGLDLIFGKESVYRGHGDQLETGRTASHGVRTFRRKGISTI